MDEQEQHPTDSAPSEPGWTYKPTDDRPVQPYGAEMGAGAAPSIPTGLKAVDNPQTAPPPEPTLTWTASEFIAHEKSGGWYALAGLAALAVSAAVYLITHDMFSTAIVVLLGILFSVIAARQPRVVSYSLSPQGVTSGARFYPYNTFKSFAVTHDQALVNVTLLPLKRFGFPLTMYMPPDDQDRIIAEIATKLPMQPNESDRVERAMHRLRF
ncbi:MAG TPA: hypothetical protein VLH84_04045 [Patescibacteria group bacterium]|nr:hypothetical protein [Patescibacteria group bacterium]